MKARFPRLAALGSRAQLASTLGLAPVLTLLSLTLGLSLSFVLFIADSAHAAGTPEQRRACTPDVYRLCPGEIPNVRAITACLRRQKTSLSEACRAAFEQADH
jgi:hypothetical protein